MTVDNQSRLPGFILMIALFLFFLLPPTDPDLGWHLKCGQTIWENHSLCQQNQFTVLLENYRWVNHYWLYQVVTFPIFRLSGPWGLTVANGLVMALAFGFLFFAIKNFLLEKIVAVLLVIFLGWGVFSLGLRSQLSGFLFFNLLLYLWGKTKANPRLGRLFPLVIFFWANMHGSFILGLILLAFLSPFSLPLSLLATLLNPNGLGVWQEAWRHFAGIDLSKLIAEWVPPEPSLWWLVVITAVLGLTRKIYVLPLLALAFLTLKARRHLPFYFSFYFYFLMVNPLFKKIAIEVGRLIPKQNLAWLVLMATFFFGLFFRLPQTADHLKNYCQNSPLGYPCPAIEFLRRQPEKGHLFNRYEWGGFLIWQLPEYQIFVDGRMPAWLTPSGKSPYTIYLEILQNQPGWQETLKEYDIDWILISPKTFMDLLLAPDPPKFGWREVFRDKISVVYQRI